MVNQVSVSLIAARGRNGVIGADGDLPWRLADDLAFFRRTTKGRPVVMGRATWESLPNRPLPGRQNIVVSRNWTYAADGARVYTSLAPALNAAKAIAARSGVDEVFVIGGGAIYAAALDFADRIYLTEVDAAPAGDTYFPDIDSGDWEEVGATPHPADERNDHAFVHRILDRKR